jgi:hypothetical protein
MAQRRVRIRVEFNCGLKRDKRSWYCRDNYVESLYFGCAEGKEDGGFILFTHRLP